MTENHPNQEPTSPKTAPVEQPQTALSGGLVKELRQNQLPPSGSVERDPEKVEEVAEQSGRVVLSETDFFKPEDVQLNQLDVQLKKNQQDAKFFQ